MRGVAIFQQFILISFAYIINSKEIKVWKTPMENNNNNVRQKRRPRQQDDVDTFNNNYATWTLSTSGMVSERKSLFYLCSSGDSFELGPQTEWFWTTDKTVGATDRMVEAPDDVSWYHAAATHKRSRLNLSPGSERNASGYYAMMSPTSLIIMVTPEIVAPEMVTLFTHEMMKPEMVINT